MREMGTEVVYTCLPCRREPFAAVIDEKGEGDVTNAARGTKIE